MSDLSTRFFVILTDYHAGVLSGRMAIVELSSLFNDILTFERQTSRHVRRHDIHFIALLKMGIINQKQRIMDDFLVNEKLIEMEAEEHGQHE